jgi:DNA-binding beta-propeller fold protein YncE
VRTRKHKLMCAVSSFVLVGSCTMVHLRPSYAGNIQHYEYAFPNDGLIYVYDMDNNFSLVKTLALPQTKNSNVKGVVANPATKMLYVSYGGDGGRYGTGALLKYDLIANMVIWNKNYTHGVDSMAITPDGSKIYMPIGETEKSSKEWKIVDTATGNDMGSFQGGLAPHNTVVSLAGTHVYMGGREDTTMYVRNIADGSLYKTIGPFIGTLRPFSINKAETLVFTTHTGFLGFQVGSITNGTVLYTAKVNGFSSSSAFTTPSHGISLSPDEKEVYVIDTANSYVHVFDVSGLPSSAPKQIADIKLKGNFSGEEANCGTGWCGKIGWVQHSRDGRFVFVGNAGDVIDTRTRQLITTLPAMTNSRMMLEIDWQNGVPLASTPREGLGYGVTP